jgi:5-methylcytosine-specific restriction enzyme A
MTEITEATALQILELIPYGRQPFYQSFRDAGISQARPLRNVQWFNKSDDGTPIFSLWRTYLRLKGSQVTAELDVRTWGRDGRTSKKAKLVVDGLTANIGKKIRVMIIEEGSDSRSANSTAFDPMLWRVEESSNDFRLVRTVDTAFPAGTSVEFTHRMLAIYDDAKQQIGYPANRFRQKVLKDGGVKAAKFWLQPSKDPTEGFARLVARNRLDLSVEAVVLNPRWSHLFEQTELDLARSRLEEFGYYEVRDSKPRQSGSLSPDEIDPNGGYPEGMKRQVTVNAYERDPKARKACIDHYGSACYVCTFDFFRTYGDLGRGYIHVHHLKKVASLGPGAVTHPIRDLRPVCPNCHAMLHQDDPPMPIGRLRLLMRPGNAKKLRRA